MSYFVVDIEADGQVPGTDMYSMVCFGAVKVADGLADTFYGQTRPISDNWVPEALAISGFSRSEHLAFDDPADVMPEFRKWVNAVSVGHPIFISDNLAFDWQYLNYYMHAYTGGNCFGYSGRRIGDMYCGLVNDSRARWKHLRKTKHDHNPVNDARGNAEVLLYMRDEMNYNIKLI